MTAPHGEISLLTNITGCPISKLFAALRRFQKHDNVQNAVKDPEEKEAALAALMAPLDETDMKIGRLAWKWMVETGDVSVGAEGEWNHLTFDDIMSVPEEPVEKGSEEPVKDSRGIQPMARRVADNPTKPTKLPKLRPCVFVDEEVVWRTLTGHGPDFKKIPNLEWKLVIAIGATREAGILQGDLVRKTGQDKRSVPKRTDFLSLKGYISKRTHMVRGSKTSKLWLTQFAPALPAPSNPLRGLDMSAGALTVDMESVPWKHQWVDNHGKNGKEEIAYMAFGQTIMAIIKAWGTVRISDLKRKLGILGRKWQMKVMSKFLRRFNSQGNISYVAATFPGDNFVFKDCVQFQRQPTPLDWSNLLATGKRHSQYSELRDKLPTKRLPKKSARSRKNGKGKGRGRPSAFNKSNVPVLEEKNRKQPSLVDSNWVQEKPLANTLTEFVMTGVAEGYTAPEISKATVGSAFRRQIFAHMNSTCAPDSQPSNLKAYQMASQLKVVGKSRAHVFTASGADEPEIGEPADEAGLIDPALRVDPSDTERPTFKADSSEGFGFGSIQAHAFLENGSSDLTILGCMEPGKPVKTKRITYVRRKTVDSNAKEIQPADSGRPEQTEATTGEQLDAPVSEQLVNANGDERKPENQEQPKTTVASADAVRTRLTRNRKASQRVFYLHEPDNVAAGSEDTNAEDANGSPSRKRRTAQKLGYFELADALEGSSSDESDFEQDRSNPGVYLGVPGSLNPETKKKGRPRKSIVLIFRSDKIKDPNYLPGWTTYPRAPTPPPRPTKAASKPRKKPTQPLTEVSGSPAPASGGPQSEQPEESDIQETETRDGVRIDESSQPDQVTVHPHETKVQTETEEPLRQPSSSATPSIIQTGEFSTIDNDEATANQAPKKASRPPKSGKGTKRRRAESSSKWICEKCGGEWKNDIGLKYHLEKAKVPCNPYYAEHPELMVKVVKAKPVRTTRALFDHLETDETRPGTSSSTSSGSSLQSIGKSSRALINEGRAATKSTTLSVVEHGDSAILRPVLKQRSILKNRHGAPGVVAPRGVQVTEAAARETAAAKPLEGSNHTVNSTDSAAHTQDPAESARPADADDEEELPYLKQLRAEQARSSRKLSSKPSVTPLEDDEESVQKQICGNENPSNSAWTGSQPTETSTLDLGPSTATDQASTAFDVYPNGVLECTATGPIVPGQGSLIQGQKDKAEKPESMQQPEGSQAPSLVNHTTNSVPSFKRPSSDTIINYEDCWATDEGGLRATRVMAIIEYLVDVNQGVFQAERVLHWAILKVYAKEFPGWPLPSMQGCSRAAHELVNQGRLRKDTMAVKTARLWTMVTIIMRPDMNINMKPVEDLKMVLKKTLPEMYIPPPFAPTESEKAFFQKQEKPLKNPKKGPGRRDHKMVEGISELNAPFYVEQGASVLRSSYRSRARVQSDDEDEPPVKRRKSRRTMQVLEDGSVEFQPRIRRRHLRNDEDGTPRKRRRGGKYVVLEPHKLSIDGSHAANPGISSLPASFFSNVAALRNSNDYLVPTEVQFFAPNTHLEDDYIPTPEPEAECQIDPRLLAADSAIEPVEEYEEPTPPVLNNESFTPIAILHDVKGTEGTWPGISAKEFEKYDGSYSMKGWMPNHTELLLDSLPKNMEQMAFKITSHCKTEQWVDPDYGDFCTSVDGCRSYELSDQGQRFLSGSIVPHYRYINFTSKPAVSNMAPCTLQWDEENDWTLETIPYEMLEDDDVVVRKPKEPEVIPLDPEADRVQAASRQSVSSRPKIQERVKPTRQYIRKADRDPRLRELKVQRELMPYPQQKSDYFRAKGEDAVGVDWKAEDTRIAAYVAVSTLMGGINKAMDWGILMRIFPEAKLSNLRKFWTMIRKEREGFINSLAEKFQEEFLEAYETGELHPVDFDDPLAYGEHWLELVRWTLALLVKESIELPPSREQFERELDLITADKGELDWRDMYHHWQRSVFNKLQDATSEPASTILPTKPDFVDNDVIVARSWIRALCCTEPSKYTPYEIRDKFLTLVREGGRTTMQVNELLQSTIFDLEHRRIAIKQKAQALSTGRPYKLNEHFGRTLDRFSNEDRFTVAAEFKLQLDKAFRNGEFVEIPWRTEDGMVIAAFNLQAHGRVRLEPIKKLDVPFGFKPGFYESRKFPKSYYRFELKVTPTPDYLYNEDIDILKRVTAVDNIPGEAEDGKLPMWCDFFGSPDRHRWFKMLSGVLFVLATRGAMTDQYVMQALKPCYEEFEIAAIRKWALKEGVLYEMTAPGGAVCVTEWWWLVAGIPMLEMTAAETQGTKVITGMPAEAGAGAGAGADVGTGEGTMENRRTKDQYAQPVGRSRRRGKYRTIY